MHFRVEHHYEGVSLEEYESLHFDEPFNVALCEAVHLRRTLVKREVVDGVLSRVVKLFPERTVPAPVVALMMVPCHGSPSGQLTSVSQPEFFCCCVFHACCWFP